MQDSRRVHDPVWDTGREIPTDFAPDSPAPSESVTRGVIET